MYSNSFGKNIAIHSYGESHGPEVGAILDGIPSNILLDFNEIQKAVNNRKTSENNFSSQRKEEDKIQIKSGVYDNKTLGSPICIAIENKDTESKDYKNIENLYRPGHADFTYSEKYNHRDHRGGGRSSIRITAPIVACGDICRQYISTHFDKIKVKAFVYQIGKIIENPTNIKSENEWEININKSEFKFPKLSLQEELKTYIDIIKEQGDTLGGAIHLSIQGLPIGLGEPIFRKFQAVLSAALFSINTVKGVEFGAGFASASMFGSEYNDLQNEDSTYKSNNAGGLLGGITNGAEVYANIAFKPISSIRQNQQMLNNKSEIVESKIDGRHDVCAVPRAVAIVEAYTYLVLADFVKEILN